MTMRTSPRLVLVLLTCCLGGANLGCAVLKIDVDVYKGGLQNQPDVQTQQVIAQAKAAKPLLVRLRYMLEESERAYQKEHWKRKKKLDPLEIAAQARLERQNAAADPAIARMTSEAATRHFECLAIQRLSTPPALLKHDPEADRMLQGDDWVDPCILCSHRARLVNQILADYSDPKDVQQRVIEVAKEAQAAATTRPGRTLSQRANEVVENALASSSEGEFSTYSKRIAARGRATPGIDTLYDLYYVRLQQLRAGEIEQDVDIRDLRERLYSALIIFSQKVTVPADFDPLFDQASGSFFRGVWKYVIHQATVGYYHDETQQKMMVRVLQAVGNSILNDIDAIKAEESAARRGREHARAESAALDRALATAPRDTYDALLDHIKRLQSDAKTRLNDANAAKQSATTALADSDIALAKAKQDAGAQDAKTNDAEAKLAEANKKVEAATKEFDKATAKLNDAESELATLEAAVVKAPSNRDVVQQRDAAKVKRDEATKEVDEAAKAKEASAKEAETKKNDSIAAKSQKDLDDAIVKRAELQLADNEQLLKEAKAAADTAATEVPLLIARYTHALADLRRQERAAMIDQYARAEPRKPSRDTVYWLLQNQIAGESTAPPTNDAPEMLKGADFDPLRTGTDSSTGKELYTALVDDLTKKENAKPSPDQTILQKLTNTKAELSAIETAIEKLPPDTRSNLFQQIQELLANQKQTVETRITERKDAASVLDDLSPALDPLSVQTVIASVGGEGRLDSKNVLDGLITVLRYQYISAVREGGKQSSRAQYLDQALSSAYRHRQDMVYIRPAWTYLRNSYPASALQQDPNLKWKNMLGDQMGRQVPLLPTAVGQSTDYTTLAALDKKYWQNINQVRVAGGGNTNYVVAKDDVGNWYVKNYSADPKKIIDAVSGLAQFAAGPALGADVLLAKERRKITEDKKAKLPVDSYVRSNLSQAATLRFENAGHRTAAEVAAALPGLRSKIETTWGTATNKEKLKPLLERAWAANLGDSSLKPATGDPGDWVVSKLENVRAMQEALARAIESELGRDAKTTAMQKANPPVKEFIEQYVKARQKAIDEYKTDSNSAGGKSAATATDSSDTAAGSKKKPA
jgi:hypothetical protein